MSSKMPEIGQGVRLKGPAMPGTGEVVAILEKNRPLAQETVMLYYGVSPETNAGQYDRVVRAMMCDRIVVKRDDAARHIILPPELFDERYVELIESPRCFKCQRLSPSQKWAAGVCPKCGHVQSVTASVPMPGVEDHVAELQEICSKFAQALFEKLCEAEKKHGWNGTWKTASHADILNGLADHIPKGDPRDVAGYCMFLWARDLSTNGK